MTDRALVVSKAVSLMLAGLVFLASVGSAAAQSKGYQPPPPPPPPRPSAPVTPAPRMTSPPPSRPQGLTSSTPSSQVPKSSASVSTPKSGAPASPPKAGTTPKPPDYAKMNPSELQKSIGSDTRQIDSYRAKVNNPRANQPNWSSMSREQQGALMRQWNDEIRRHETSRATAQKALTQKAR